ncbi:MAG: class I SAM-dependent methyltransferase [Ginsengibacter sp.]
MQNQNEIIDCYNKTSKNYAEKFIDELQHKHLDRLLLKSFANENINRGKMADFGCGPGQTTKFLSECGIHDITGIDISPSMVKVAACFNPGITFEVGDLLDLKNYAGSSFGSAIAFYAIVHFDHTQLKKGFFEIKRVLAENGQFLFSFHIGNGVIHLDNLLNEMVDIDFYFFETNSVRQLLQETGFQIIDVIEREPYPEVEYPSRRAYIWAKKQS